MRVKIARNPVVVAVSLCAVFLCTWIIFIASKNPPVDRRVSNLTLSASGRWLAAGTAQGKITVWDQTHPDTPQQIVFAHGSLNDLHFSPDEHALAIASEDLGIYTPAVPAAPRLLRSDHANYGSVRDSAWTVKTSWSSLGTVSSKQSTNTLERGAAQSVLFFHLRRCRFHP
jgi:WD40 repeat protein